jgi:hypothetical protein
MKIQSIEHLFNLLEVQGFTENKHNAQHQIFEIEQSYYNGIRQQAIKDLTITENTSDGYHTFKELYEFRMMYNAILFNEWNKNVLPKYDVHKSFKHNDGELCFGGGWFVVVAMLPSGQITNHYEAKYWDLFIIPEVEKAKYKFDGHTSNDVFERLKSLIMS